MNWLFDRLASYGNTPALVYNGVDYPYSFLLENWQPCKRGEIVAIEGGFTPANCVRLLSVFAKDGIAAMIGRERHRQILDAQRDNPLFAQLNGNAGLILFTSGTTGEPKAALHDATRLLEKFREPRKPWRMVAFLLFDHIGGINTLLSTLSSGGTLIIADKRDPDSICALIERYRADVLPVNPSFLNFLLMNGAHTRHDLSSLRVISYGTEKMPTPVLARLRVAFPSVRFRQLYGLAELGILRAKSESNDSLWVRIGGEGYETKIVDGTLRIRARAAMLGYLNAPSPFDAEGWYNTGDLVEARGEFVRFMGRQSEVINVGGKKVSPQEVENVLAGMDNVADVAVYKQANALLGEVVAAKFNLCVPEDAAEFRVRVRDWCATRLVPCQIPVVIEVTDAPLFNERGKKVRKEGNNG